MRIFKLFLAVINYSIRSFVVVMAIGMVQLMFLMLEDEIVFVELGLPYDFYFFTKYTEFQLHGFKSKHLLVDFLIFFIFFLVLDHLKRFVQKRYFKEMWK